MAGTGFGSASTSASNQSQRPGLKSPQGLQAVADLVGNGMQSWLMVRSWFGWLVTLVCGEANLCSVTIEVRLI